MAKILIIDDDPEMRRLLIEVMSQLGHLTVFAQDGYSGLAAAQRERPDLIICDFRMPAGDGLSVLHRLRETSYGASTPVVIVTGAYKEFDVSVALPEGVEVLVKPVDLPALRGCVQGLLSRWASNAAAEDLAKPREKRNSILIVEDDADMAAFLTTLLRRKYPNTAWSADGEEGLRRAISESPDLILLDLRMPRVNGVQALEVLVSDPRTAHIPVIIMTNALVDASTRDHCASLPNVKAFLTKGSNPESVLKHVDGVLETK